MTQHSPWQRVLNEIAALPEGDVRRLEGGEDLWRLRIGDWRISFHYDDGERLVSILAVQPPRRR